MPTSGVDFPAGCHALTMPAALEGLRTVIDPSSFVYQVGGYEHVPVAEVGDGIVIASVRTPPGAILGLIHNPHLGGS